MRARALRARSGDDEAFGALFRSLEKDVIRLCIHLLGSADEAEDAASEAFLRARRALDGYDAAQPFRSWLLSIAAHHAIDRLRRRATEKRLFDSAELDAEATPSPGPSPLRLELNAERSRQLRAAVDALPDRYRAPLVLRYFADLDYASIADQLDVSRGQVATLLFRGRQRLRALLQDGGGEAP
jgi:RNA polymerase sigma-70 factor (ECF subfamily)